RIAGPAQPPNRAGVRGREHTSSSAPSNVNSPPAPSFESLTRLRGSQALPLSSNATALNATPALASNPPLGSGKTPSPARAPRPSSTCGPGALDSGRGCSVRVGCSGWATGAGRGVGRSTGGSGAGGPLSTRTLGLIMSATIRAVARLTSAQVAP